MAFPNAETTDKSTQVIPEVMAQMIAARLPKAIKFSPLATVDNTLVGVPGDTITVPHFKYIGDAVDFAEGEKIDYSKLQTGTTKSTIKRAGKGVEISDYAVQTGLGDPKTEAANQLSLSIGSKVDSDALTALLNARLTLTHAEPDLDLIDAIEATFEDDTSEFNVEDANPVHGTLIMNVKDFSKLRKAASNNFARATELGDTILVNGTLGEIFGWQILTSRKVPVGTFLAVKPGALGINMKRGVQVETARDIDFKTTKVNVDEYYGVWLKDDTRALVVNKPTGGTPGEA
ncbi:N4-gp56 family major capsid protein [Lapidilactobacillus mulanensis]|uniref:N4-gp56 family major capsid protein n=1 Tax=Lapidilactobacillus mulanensis TaxID=2485999 RepID=A0ABW4DSH9_9LACO|nr:N4-gp56 family major capsid protein [Lapidilactobacillus mulanensis]